MAQSFRDLGGAFTLDHQIIKQFGKESTPVSGRACPGVVARQVDQVVKKGTAAAPKTGKDSSWHGAGTIHRGRTTSGGAGEALSGEALRGGTRAAGRDRHGRGDSATQP